MKAKWAIAAAAVTVYMTVPAYRYWVLGSWVAWKILNDKPRYRVVPKGSRHYKRIVQGANPGLSAVDKSG